MLRTARLLALCLLTATVPLFGQAGTPTVVVLTFEDGGSYGLDSLDFAGLGRGISAMLTAGLARNSALRALSRSDAAAIVDQGGLARNGRMDAGTSAKVGKQVGAAYVVAGTFVDYYGKVRIDARLIDTGNGAILEVVSSGQRGRAELSQMIADIAAQLMSGKHLPAAPAGTAVSTPISTDALLLFGRAVMSQDQGNKAEAVQYYQRAIKLAPDFTTAKDGLRSVQ